MSLVSLALLFLLAGDSFELGLEYYGRREYAKAAEQFAQVLAKEDPASPAYRDSTLYLAQSLYLTNHFQESVPYLEKAIAAKTRELEARYMLGNAYVQLHDQEKAAQAFAGLYGVPPGSAGAYLIAAQMMIRQGLEELAEVISVIPAMRPNCRSSGVATADAIVSGLAPGRLALTLIEGKST